MNSAAARPVYLAGQFSYWSIANESLEYARAVWLVRNAVWAEYTTDALWLVDLELGVEGTQPRQT